MCRGCDVETGAGWGRLWELSGPDERARQRAGQAEVIRRIFAGHPVTCREFGAGDSFVLGTPTGRTEVVYGLRHVWAAAGDLVGHRIDVLDESVLDRFESP